MWACSKSFPTGLSDNRPLSSKVLYHISTCYPWPSRQSRQVHPVEDIGYHLHLWTGWIRCNCDARRRQEYVKLLYNQVPQTAWVSWSSSCSSRQWEPAPDRGLGPSGPRLSNPAEWGRSAAIVRGTWGQYVAVCSVSNSPLTHNPFATLSWIKCERYIFLKKCVRSSLLLTMFSHIFIYMYMYCVVVCGFTTICYNVWPFEWI